MSVPTNHDQRRVAVVTTTIRIPHALLGNMDQFCRLDRPAPLVAVVGDRRTPPSIRRWRMEGTGLNRAQAARLPLYERTRQFRAGCWVLPGLIQTEAYTRAVLRAAQQRRGLPDDVEAAVATRIARQRVLRRGGRTAAFLLEESALRNGFGGQHR